MTIINNENDLPKPAIRNTKTKHISMNIKCLLHFERKLNIKMRISQKGYRVYTQF